MSLPAIHDYSKRGLLVITVEAGLPTERVGVVFESIAAFWQLAEGNSQGISCSVPTVLCSQFLKKENRNFLLKDGYALPAKRIPLRAYRYKVLKSLVNLASNPSASTKGEVRDLERKRMAWSLSVDGVGTFADVVEEEEGGTKWLLVRESPILNNKLFRSPPSNQTLTEDAQITLHPVLQNGANFIGTDHTEFTIFNFAASRYFSHESTTEEGIPELRPGVPLWTGKEEWKIAELNCAREFATFPAVKKVAFLPYDPPLGFRGIGPGGLLERDEGVRVIDVLREVAQLWSQKVDYIHVDEITRRLTYFIDTTYVNAMSYSEHCFWGGWGVQFLDPQGVFVLGPAEVEFASEKKGAPVLRFRLQSRFHHAVRKNLLSVGIISKGFNECSLIIPAYGEISPKTISTGNVEADIAAGAEGH
ncbi:hypothetical protein T439DRAFT_336551 [Meredithblackwellia eburnea MCA 4105]